MLTQESPAPNPVVTASTNALLSTARPEAGKMVHCIYCSAATDAGFTPAKLQALLQAARSTNAELGITGMLLYHQGSFFQILEGESSAVESLFDKIATDERHTGVIKIILEPIAKRDFSDWTMGYSSATPADLQKIPGLNDFFAQDESYLDIGESRARVLLEAFRQGRWHASLGPKKSVHRSSF